MCEFLLLCAVAIRAHSPRCRENTSQTEQVVVSAHGVSSLCDLEKLCSLEAACLLRTVATFTADAKKSGHHLTRLCLFYERAVHWLHHALVLDRLARHWGKCQSKQQGLATNVRKRIHCS